MGVEWGVKDREDKEVRRRRGRERNVSFWFKKGGENNTNNTHTKVTSLTISVLYGVIWDMEITHVSGGYSLIQES